MTGRTAGDNGRNVGRLENKLLIFVRDAALVGCEEHGAALYAFGAEHHGSCHAAAVRNAAGSDDRNAQRVHDLRHERHGRQLADMAAALHAFCDDCIRAGTLHALCQCNRCNDRHDLDTGSLPRGHIFARVACAGGQHLDLFVDRELRQIIGVRGEQHDVHAERLVRDLTRLADLVADIIYRRGAACNDAEAACLGYGSGEMMLGDPRHRALHDRIFDAEKFCDLGFHNKTPLFFTVSVQMRHR